jgi:hypothetical protein
LPDAPPLRVFISSPGDVTAAREVVAQTVERVAAEHRRFFRLQAFLWENEAMLASGHFQDSIEPPSKFDIVILLLGSRLGTPLPTQTALREYRGIDGRAPVTGTEWEFEEALAAARQHGAPDLLVYRSQQDVRISSVDLAAQQKQLAQLEALNAFWTRHFEDRGTFIGAYSRFNDLDQLAHAVERDLGSLLKRRIAAQRGAGEAAGPIWTGDPFRGLEAYEFQHAPIFFGRTETIGRAMLQLLDGIERGHAFLLVVGASGTGKSSLVKAGIAPRLFEPRRLPGACVLRRVVFRPGETAVGEDVFAALARRLTDTEASDASVGLPELLGGAMSAASLAEHLRQTHASPAFAFNRTLEDIAVAARRAGRMLDYQQARLLLVVDQLEELYTAPHIPAADRGRFIAFLAGLAASGSVIVIATLRSDLWGRAAETPQLLQLAEGPGRLDLAGPSPAEIGQLIRLPAEAAGLGFETDPDSGIALNERIAEAAAGEADALPLISALLGALYRADGPGGELTFATFRQLGELKGAIAARADAVLAAHGPEGPAALARLLFALVQLAEGDARPVSRRVRLASFAPGSAERRLADALADARLLVLDADTAADPTMRIAHEALLGHWEAARGAIAGQTVALRTRRMVEAKLQRFRELAGGPRRRGLLAGRTPGMLTGVDLADARALVGAYRDQLGSDLASYIDRSAADDARARRSGVVRWAAVALLVLGLGAGARAAVRWATIQGVDRDLLRSESAARNAYYAGDLKAALAGFQADEKLARQLIAMDGGDPKWRYNLAAAYAAEAFTLKKEGDLTNARRQYDLAVRALADLAQRDAGDAGLQADGAKLQATLSQNPIGSANGS